MKPSLILLAAGNSTRFGGENKLLFSLDDMPMWEHLARRALACKDCFSQLILVSQYPEIEQAAQKMGFTVCHNPHGGDGIASSLKLGICAADSQTPLLFAVCDQPYLSQQTLSGFAERLPQESILTAAAQTESGIRVGNPVGFAPEFREELLALTGDTGGRRVAKAHPEAVSYYFVPERELEDMDYR
jgi:molybdenum cofactor cytidylyltransferase